MIIINVYLNTLPLMVIFIIVACPTGKTTYVVQAICEERMQPAFEQCRQLATGNELHNKILALLM